MLLVLRTLSVTTAAAGLVTVGAAPAAASGKVVADWQMNEHGGTTMLDSTGRNNGTVQGIDPNGSFYAFDGSGSLATATQNFDIGSSDISFTARIRFKQIPSSTVGDYDIVRGAPTGKWKLEIVRRDNGTTAKANCHFAGTSGGSQLAAGPTLADGRWHTISCAKTAARIVLTVDGASYGKNFAVGSIDTTGKVVALGGQTASADQFLGDMDYATVSVG